MRAKRHHTVPRVYLSRFADAQGQIIMIDREGEGVITTSVANAAVEKDFYTVRTKEGLPTDAVEKIFAKVESNTAKAFTSIDQGVWPLSLEDRAGLSNFIAGQLVRGKDFRALMQDFTHQAMAMTLRVAATNPQSVRSRLTEIMGAEPTEEELQDTLEWMKDPTFRVEGNEHFTMVAYEAAGDLVQPIANMKWQLLEVGEPLLMTSDSPVVMWRQPSEGGQFWGVGLDTADEVTLPLDPHRCLLLLPERDVGEVRWQIGPADAAAINLRTVRSAHRFAFASPSTPLPQVEEEGPTNVSEEGGAEATHRRT